MLLDEATRYMFFVGKGGVGKTAVACATAIHLADAGQRVLLLSTDPASNLDEVLATPLGPTPRQLPGVPGLSAMNLDPAVATAEYKTRLVTSVADVWPKERLAALQQVLAGACTTEIAMLEAFATVLTDASLAGQFDRIVFDTAPTGHTLGLLELAGLWTSFLTTFPTELPLRPYVGLKDEVARLQAVAATLRDGVATTVVLVARPERAPIAECLRALTELKSVGIAHFVLAMNAAFRATDRSDAVAAALERRDAAALDTLPPELSALARVSIPLQAGPLLGVAALRTLFAAEPLAPAAPAEAAQRPPLPGLSALVQELQAASTGLILVMGKGGVGKTTIAAALAVALAEHGHDVTLTTTDPAGQLDAVVPDPPATLMVSTPDPLEETHTFVDSMLKARGKGLGPQETAAMQQELASPCAQDVAMFRAFARAVAAAQRRVVVIDAAATGHSLLLLDATGAYHRETVDEMARSGLRVTTPLMRLQDPAYAKVVLVTLPEATPVSEAAALQQELRENGVEPWAWVVNQSLAVTGTRDPVLRSKAAQELGQIQRIEAGLARRIAVVPWLPEEPCGSEFLRRIVRGDA